ncbi:MAG TPA: hypothetical protein VHS03_05995 [Gaiellaceae bacterium]|jgi:hypothetical protein|nr:hypothetical protein [Gaiellaceae bacterium]
MKLQRRRFLHLRKIARNQCKPARDRRRAEWGLDRWYPKRRGRLLPTRLGNSIRAFEEHSNVRWGLDGVTIWPRIEALLSSDERELLVDAKINLYVFLNGSVGAVVLGTCLVVDQAVYGARPTWVWALLTIPFVVSYALYRASVGPAIDWGSVVRASIDLHRPELYAKLGVRTPVCFTDERKIALRVNQLLLYGRPPLPDSLWGASQNDSQKSKA